MDASPHITFISIAHIVTGFINITIYTHQLHQYVIDVHVHWSSSLLSAISLSSDGTHVCSVSFTASDIQADISMVLRKNTYALFTLCHMWQNISRQNHVFIRITDNCTINSNISIVLFSERRDLQFTPIGFDCIATKCCPSVLYLTRTTTLILSRIPALPSRPVSSSSFVAIWGLASLHTPSSP